MYPARHKSRSRGDRRLEATARDLEATVWDVRRVTMRYGTWQNGIERYKAERGHHATAGNGDGGRGQWGRRTTAMAWHNRREVRH